ncbi:MAG: polysaccharide deacetylase family protein, partial [Opitutaceae bacterium]
FFVVGRRALSHPELIAEAVRRGHTVAHHTLSHPLATFWCAGPRTVRREIDGGLAALARCSVRPAWFRPPAGMKNVFLRGALRRCGLACVGWTVRSGDGFARSAEAIVKRVRDRTEPGAILLMHEGPSVPANLRVRAIEQVVDALHADGFVFVVPASARLR